jgi:hypothetical protein
MAYEKTYCANPECPKHTVYTGGKFLYSFERKGFYCQDCYYDRGPILPNTAKSAFEFVTTAFTGKPIQVNGIKHLERLEKQYGCSSVVLNNNQSNWGSPNTPRENWQAPPKEIFPGGVTTREARR